jgi:Icc-related predicted phosphoesterase
MTILIVADLHGRWLLALKLATRLQKERNLQLDLILQCGDMGIYPDPARFDKATLRHARHDETELGFSRYFAKPNDEVKHLWEQLSCECIAVRGNHEDHEFLNQLEKQSTQTRFPVDYYQRIQVCKTGHLQTFAKDNQTLTVAGIGRMGYRGNKRPGENQRFIQPYERDRLTALRQHTRHVDILLSHDCPLHQFDKDFGMPEIRGFLDYHKPFYHFFGHTGHPYQAVTDENRLTTSVKVAEMEWQPGGTLPHGSLVLLHWHDSFDHKLEVVNDSWIKEYTFESWKYL